MVLARHRREDNPPIEAKAIDQAWQCVGDATVWRLERGGVIVWRCSQSGPARHTGGAVEGTGEGALDALTGGRVLGECAKCEVSVDAVVEGRYSYCEDDFTPETTILLARCPRCSSPIVIEYDEISTISSPRQIYPLLDRPISRAVPESIRSGFTEARACLRVHAYTATALMCRRTIEAVAVDHAVKERTLADSLRVMKERGIIEHRLFEWAEALRLVGNEAAHEVERDIHGQDAIDAVEFTSAILEYLYTFRDRFEAFKKRRAQVTDGV